MSYLSKDQLKELEQLLKTFFSLPYSTDLDGKDAETLIRIVKNATGPHSRKKELFDIVDGNNGYSVKTLFKPPNSIRVDLQEQRFCDVEEVRRMRSEGKGSASKQGKILLKYMHDRICEQMHERSIENARSLILLKHWNKSKNNFSFIYWEEDFLGYIKNLIDRDEKEEIEWVEQEAGLHARDKLRLAHKRGNTASSPEPVRLLRMHYKHNQIFTDHDIPSDADRMQFSTTQRTWSEISKLVIGEPNT